MGKNHSSMLVQGCRVRHEQFSFGTLLFKRVNLLGRGCKACGLQFNLQAAGLHLSLIIL